MQPLSSLGLIVAAFVALILLLPKKTQLREQNKMLTKQPNGQKPLIIAGICGAIALLAGLLGFYVGASTTTVDPTTIPVNWIASAFVPAVVTVIAVFAVHRMLSSARESQRYLQGMLQEKAEKLVSTVREVCLPNMHALSGPYAVMEDATALIAEATKERETLWYYGTSNLTGSEEQRDPTHELQQVREDYRSAMSLAHTEQVPIVRFMALDSAVDFALRLENNQHEYKEWIQHQIQLMEKNRAYELYHSLRAPHLGSSSHTISTKDSMILMVGNGTLGLRINGESIVRPFRDNWTRMFEGKSGKPQLYSAKRLQRYLDEELKLPPTVHQLTDGDALVETLVAELEKVIGSRAGGIVYVGSGGLLASEDVISSSLADRYEHVIHELQDQGVPFDRYICLLDEKDFQSRSVETKKRYLRWLEKQVALLKEYEEYSFYHAPRAVPWGSTKSCIFTPFGYFEVVGNGMRGLFVSGEELARDCEAATRRALDENVFKKPDKFTAARLQEYCDGLEAVLEGKPKPKRRRTRRSTPNSQNN